MKTLPAIIACVAISVPVLACEPAPATAPTLPVATDSAFARDAAAAGAVFEGNVVDVGRAPGFWSGIFAAYQTVTYRVTKVHADRDHRVAVGAKVAVRHLIVAKSETADSEPRLRPGLIHVGATLIVLADWTDSDKQWTGIDERYGVVPADASHLAALTGR